MAAFDIENEAIHLAEKAAQWTTDWVDYAEAAEKSLKAARLAGLKEALEIIDRCARDCTVYMGGPSDFQKGATNTKQEATIKITARIASLEKEGK